MRGHLAGGGLNDDPREIGSRSLVLPEPRKHIVEDRVQAMSRRPACGVSYQRVVSDVEGTSAALVSGLLPIGIVRPARSLHICDSSRSETQLARRRRCRQRHHSAAGR